MNEVLRILKYFFDKIDSQQLSHQQEHFIISELKNLGIPPDRIQQVMAFMGDLAEPEAQQPIEGYPLQLTTGTRIFSPLECARLSRKCRSYLLNLENSGVLSAITRELVLDQLLGMNAEHINITSIKWTVLNVLCHQSDKAATTSMERYLLSETSNCSH